MSAKFMLDTNVLVYAGDADEPVKRPIALDVIRMIASRDAGVVTTQVLAEYFVTVTRRFAAKLTVTEAIERLQRIADTFSVLDVAAPVVHEAVRGVERYAMPYWDAQVWASARLAGISTVLSEDLPGHREIEGVRFVDPFADGFDLEALLG